MRSRRPARIRPSTRARVAVTGGSQGGGISIAVAALVPDIAAVMPDVPFLADFGRAITITDHDPYTEIARYLKAHRDHTDRVLRTLAYFDVAILGRRAKAPALFSVGLMDEICRPRPSTAHTTSTPARRRSPSTRSTTTRVAGGSTTS